MPNEIWQKIYVSHTYFFAKSGVASKSIGVSLRESGGLELDDSAPQNVAQQMGPHGT